MTGRKPTVRHPDHPIYCGCTTGCLLGRRNRSGVVCRYHGYEVKSLRQLGLDTDPDRDREFHVGEGMGE